ncbi:MAG: hypothetical protein Q9196_001596 [Gyalolechia fulgens]
MAGAVRQPVDVDSLSTYLGHNVPAIKLPIQIKQACGQPLEFGFGQSNPTYQLIAADDKKYVLRKKPPGKLLSKTAHQVEREYRIIHALDKTDVPVPKTYCLCEDATVIGTPFYVMEFLDGRIFEDASFPAVRADERREMWYDAVQTLAKLHRLSPASVGLSDFGKPSGFYDRQLKTFSTISESQANTIDVETQIAVGQIPHFDDMVAFFSNPETQPRDRATLIHGDYKIDNLVFDRTEPRVIGILDPETGWGDAFGVFRNSAIMQGIAARYATRQASSARAGVYAAQMKPYGEFAWGLVDRLMQQLPPKQAKL